jgi:hypothetical protein
VLLWLSQLGNGWVFAILWLATLALYVPTHKAGWVIDASGLLYNIQHENFGGFVNSTQSGDQGFYQMLTLPYYLFYKMFGLNDWFWGILFVTIQSTNGVLFFIFSKRLLSDSKVEDAVLVSLSVAILFTVSPYISEVVVWRACFHYLLSFCFILLTLLLAQNFIRTLSTRYALGSVILFIFSAATHPVFYLVPFFVLLLVYYYRYALGCDKEKFRKAILCIILPQLVLFAIYFFLLYSTYHTIRPHKTAFNESIHDYLSKPIKYLFHIIFLGRFLSVDIKERMYHLCENYITIAAGYGLLLTYFVFSFTRLKRLGNNAKVILFLGAIVVMFLFFLIPLSFPNPELLVFYDRYTYFSLAFVYLLVATIVSGVKNKYILIVLFCAYVDSSLYFTIELNNYWVDSDLINRKLLQGFPRVDNKTVLLLNNPENMNGVPMIGSSPDGEFKSLLEIYTGKILPNTIYDVASYNMVANYNGAHVTVINDTTIDVGLNHGGTWWWYDGHGAKNYETPDYTTDFKTKGLLYRLTLKHPVNNYLLLYSVGEQWKVVDVGLKNKQQD